MGRDGATARYGAMARDGASARDGAIPSREHLDAGRRTDGHVSGGSMCARARERQTARVSASYPGAFDPGGGVGDRRVARGRHARKVAVLVASAEGEAPCGAARVSGAGRVARDSRRWSWHRRRWALGNRRHVWEFGRVKSRQRLTCYIAKRGHGGVEIDARASPIAAHLARRQAARTVARVV